MPLIAVGLPLLMDVNEFSGRGIAGEMQRALRCANVHMHASTDAPPSVREISAYRCK